MLDLCVLLHAEPFVNYNLENLSGISVESEDMLSTTETTSKDKPLGLSLNDFLGNYVSGNMNLYSGFINGYTGMIGTGQIPSLGPRHQTLKLQQQVNSPNNQKESRDPSASSQISLTSGFISGYPGMLGLDNPKMAQLNNQIKVSRTNNEGQLPYGTDRGAHVSNDYIPSTFETDYSFKPGYFGQIASVDKDLISEQSEFGNTANRPGQLPHAYSTDDFGTNTFGQIGSSAKERTSSQMSNDSEFGNSVAHGIDPEQNGDVKGSSHSVNWNGEWPGQTSLRAGVNTGNDKSQPGNFGPQAFGGTEPKTWDGSWAEGWPEHSDKNNNSAKVFNDLKTLLDRMTSNSG
ncbi:hypothetical protein ACJMK2_037223 [Sinanodonta woodiana]|uniref:Uncharacterized protein n=1 Tax=Sinanodonta woodiana TaxID=1069815 RepID=A0ABD3WJN5_SINWO